jgi:hypothetical protein
MDLQLKFLEDELAYEVDDWFYQQLGYYSIDDASRIIGQTVSVMEFLPIKNGWTQEVAGVIKKEEPIFFVVEYLKQETERPILVDLNEIDVDEYLDFISNNNSIKSYIINNEPIRNFILEGGTIQPPENNSEDSLRS